MAGKSTTYHRGEMDIHEQAATYEFVMKLTKWGSLAVASLVLFLVLWFCTGTGFFGAAITAIVLIALGVFFLRAKPEAAGAH
jgi:membrane-bound ClpP family serine protease